MVLRVMIYQCIRVSVRFNDYIISIESGKTEVRRDVML